LLEHAVKVVERIFEYKIRQWIDTHDMQFGFMEGKGTTDATLLGHFLIDDLIDPVKMSICMSVCTSVHLYIHNETQCSHKPNSGIC